MNHRRALFRNPLNFGAIKDDHNNAGKDKTGWVGRMPVEALQLWIDKITVEYSVIFIGLPLTSSARL
jgi:hypothetical protein